MSDSYQGITDVVQVYFDGLYECDPEKLATIFHPSCHLFANMDGTFVDWPREEWFEIVRGRESPASKGQARHDRIVSIDMSDDNTAVVTCECAIHPRYFTDFLSLIRIDDPRLEDRLEIVPLRRPRIDGPLAQPARAARV